MFTIIRRCCLTGQEQTDPSLDFIVSQKGELVKELVHFVQLNLT